MHAKDHQIIELLQQQDKKAIDALYDQYSPALYGIVLKIVRSEMVAQDVLQEAFVKIWSKGSSYGSFERHLVYLDAQHYPQYGHRQAKDGRNPEQKFQKEYSGWFYRSTN